MQNRTSPTFTSTLRGYGRRISSMMNLSPADRVQLQLSNSPVAVLGTNHRRR